MSEKTATTGVGFAPRGTGFVLEGPADTLTVGAEVYAAGGPNSRQAVYGPYRVAYATQPSPNGNVTAFAYKVSQAASGVPDITRMTKAELIQFVAQQQAASELRFKELEEKLTAPTAPAKK